MKSEVTNFRRKYCSQWRYWFPWRQINRSYLKELPSENTFLVSVELYEENALSEKHMSNCDPFNLSPSHPRLRPEIMCCLNPDQTI